MTSHGIEAPTLKFLAPYLAKLFTPGLRPQSYNALGASHKEVYFDGVHKFVALDWRSSHPILFPKVFHLLSNIEVEVVAIRYYPCLTLGGKTATNGNLAVS